MISSSHPLFIPHYVLEAFQGIKKIECTIVSTKCSHRNPARASRRRPDLETGLAEPLREPLGAARTCVARKLEQILREHQMSGPCSEDTADDLDGNIGKGYVDCDFPTNQEGKGNGRVEMRTGDWSKHRNQYHQYGTRRNSISEHSRTRRPRPSLRGCSPHKG